MAASTIADKTDPLSSENSASEPLVFQRDFNIVMRFSKKMVLSRKIDPQSLAIWVAWPGKDWERLLNQKVDWDKGELSASLNVVGSRQAIFSGRPNEDSEPIATSHRINSKSPDPLKYIFEPGWDFLFRGVWGHAAEFLNGKLYIIGGKDGERLQNLSYSYDPTVNLWVIDYRLFGAEILRHGAYATLSRVDNKLYAIGGQDFQYPTAAVTIITPQSSQTSAHGPPMPTARRSHAAAVVNGIVYVIGGFDPTNGYATQAVEAYDPRTAEWISMPPLPTPRWNHAAAAVGGRIYVFGGLTGLGATSPSNSIEVFDPKKNIWTSAAPMPFDSMGQATTVLGGKVYFFGGHSSGGISSRADVFDPATGEWRSLKPMPRPNYFSTANAFNGMIYMVGGYDGFSPLAILWRYDPLSDEWTDLSPAPRHEEAKTQDNATVSVFTPLSDVDRFSKRPGSRPDDFALVVGVENYRSVQAAAFAENDAKVMSKLIHDYLGVPESHLVLLTGPQANLSDITKYIEEWLPRNAGPKSRVYVYFSGHGAPDPASGKGYLMPHDGDPAFLQSSGYPTQSLYAHLQSLKAPEVIVMLDSCFSGQGPRSVAAQGARPLVNVLALPSEDSEKLTIISAARSDEIATSFEAEKHGTFTYYLLKGLEGAAQVDRAGHITIDALDRYVSENVSTAAAKQGQSQTPQFKTKFRNLAIY